MQREKTITRGAMAALCVLFVGSGCATFQVQKNLYALMGRSEKEAVEVLGEPLKKEQTGGNTVYTWAVYAFYANTGLDDFSYEVSCDIELVANDQGKFVRSEHHEKNGGCDGYAWKLDYYAQYIAFIKRIPQEVIVRDGLGSFRVKSVEPQGDVLALTLAHEGPTSRALSRLQLRVRVHDAVMALAAKAYLGSRQVNVKINDADLKDYLQPN